MSPQMEFDPRTLALDEHSALPPYEQLRAHLVDKIESRELTPGTKLPPVRRLAEELGIAPNTVARTYRELEAAGYVVTAGRNGTIVATPGAGAAESELAEQALGLATSYALAMRGLGLSPDDMHALLRRALAQLG